MAFCIAVKSDSSLKGLGQKLDGPSFHGFDFEQFHAVGFPTGTQSL
jgi:hypothetical protein